jgi:hypothetical protein
MEAVAMVVIFVNCAAAVDASATIPSLMLMAAAKVLPCRHRPPIP